MPNRTINHAVFWFSDGQVQRFALRGETVDLPAAEAERGDALDAFIVDEPAQGAEPADLGAFPDDADGQDGWLGRAHVDEVLAAVQERPEIRQSVIDAETRRDKPRVTLLTALSR